MAEPLRVLVVDDEVPLIVTGHTAGAGRLPTALGLAVEGCFAFALTFTGSHAHEGSTGPAAGMLAGSPRTVGPVLSGHLTAVLAVDRSSGSCDVLLHHVERRGPPVPAGTHPVA